jgi:4-aminobutyrate aminotransferase-like enzyme
MGNIVTLTPPLTITTRQMSKALGILEQCFEELGKQKR